MRNRFYGAIALLLGVLMVWVMIVSTDEVSLGILFGTAVFIGVGGWQLMTGRGLASITDFLVKGKVIEKTRQSPSDKP